MKVLGIDTASPIASVAIVEDERVLVELRSTTTGHRADLLVLVDAACQQANVKPLELDAIAIGAGPGSFTGLRIGMATAKGIAFAAKRPLWAVSSLAALAHAATRGSIERSEAVRVDVEECVTRSEAARVDVDIRDEAAPVDVDGGTRDEAAPVDVDGGTRDEAARVDVEGVTRDEAGPSHPGRAAHVARYARSEAVRVDVEGGVTRDEAAPSHRERAAVTHADAPATAVVASDTLVIAVLDAKRGEVYAGAYRNGVLVGRERAVSPEELVDSIADSEHVHFYGAASYPELAARLDATWGQTPSAASVALLALAGARVDVLLHGAPSYIRPSEAEIKYPDGVPGALRKR